jgi:hypothetical protein
MLQCGTLGQFAAHACGPVGPRDHLGAGQCEHELVFRKGGTTASVRVASASWINQVERWFAEPTRKRLRRGVHTSVRQLEADIRAFIDRHNENPKPFKWTNLQTKAGLQLSASAAKLSRPYATKFRFT